MPQSTSMEPLDVRGLYGVSRVSTCVISFDKINFCGKAISILSVVEKVATGTDLHRMCNIFWKSTISPMWLEHKSLWICVADVTTTVSSSTAASAGSSAISSQEISSLPSSHRMSAYRSKYLQDKEQQQAEPPSSTVKPSSRDTTSVTTADQKDGNDNMTLLLTRSVSDS